MTIILKDKTTYWAEVTSIKFKDDCIVFKRLDNKHSHKLAIKDIEIIKEN